MPRIERENGDSLSDATVERACTPSAPQPGLDNDPTSNGLIIGHTE